MTRTPSPLYRELASIFQAYLNCADRPSTDEWRNNHKETIEALVENFLPSGSGIDCGTTFDFDASKPDKLVLTFSYHHMNEGGYYDGWTEHSLVVRPSLAHGIDLRITGRDRNQVKDYLYEVYDCALRQKVWQAESGNWSSSQYAPLPQPTE